MAIKKSELYSSLWQSCDELRGGMDASQYKDCVPSSESENRMSVMRHLFMILFTDARRC